MKIPCDANQHWERLRVGFVFKEGEFDPQQFRDAVESDSDNRTEWLISDEENPACHSHIEIGPLRTVAPDEEEADKEGKPEVPLRVVEVQSYRFPAAEEVDGSMVLTHDQALTALVAASDLDEFWLSIFTDLTFDFNTADWRIPQLAEPPEITELEEDIGRIILSGLSLRFERSKRGLWGVQLEIDPQETTYLVSLHFTQKLTEQDLADPFVPILEKAETFSQLFVDIAPED